jgi:hypothetical protein
MGEQEPAGSSDDRELIPGRRAVFLQPVYQLRDSILGPHQIHEWRIVSQLLQVRVVVQAKPVLGSLGERLTQQIDGGLPLTKERRNAGTPVRV